MKKIATCFCLLVLPEAVSAQDYKTCMLHCNKEKDFHYCNNFCVKPPDKFQACQGAVQRSKKQTDALSACKNELEAANLSKPVHDGIVSIIEEIVKTPDAETDTAEYHELLKSAVDGLKSLRGLTGGRNPDWDEDFIRPQRN